MGVELSVYTVLCVGVRTKHFNTTMCEGKYVKLGKINGMDDEMNE